MLHLFPLSYKVTVMNIDTDTVIIKDAEADFEGLIEMLHRFLDISEEDFYDFIFNMRNFEAEQYSVMGKKGSEDPWVIVVNENPLVIPRPGFWKRIWEIWTW